MKPSPSLSVWSVPFLPAAKSAQRRDAGADVEAGRRRGRGVRVLAPGGHQVDVVRERVDQHAALVAVVGVVDLGALELLQAERDVVLVAVRIGERAGRRVGVEVDVDGDRGVAVPDRRHPHRVAVLEGIGAGGRVASDAETDQHLRRERVLGHEREAPVPGLVAAGERVGRVGGREGVEGRRRGEARAEPVGDDLRRKPPAVPPGTESGVVTRLPPPSRVVYWTVRALAPGL